MCSEKWRKAQNKKKRMIQKKPKKFQGKFNAGSEKLQMKLTATRY